MRIIQLSDIHLSQPNLIELNNYYREALIKDLGVFNFEKQIDVILLTGDLIDKGGESLGPHPYETFKNEFINPLITQLNIPKDRMLFIPGNHDTNTEYIEKENEYFMVHNLTKESANEKLAETERGFINANKRIEKFKLFEKEFHNSNPDYTYSNNHSLYIATEGPFKVGFALINDSWRCSPDLKNEHHFVGCNQLFNSKTYFNKKETDINIAVFHHPLEVLNDEEAGEIENILKSQKFSIAIFGHSHQHKFESLISPTGGFLSLNGRSAFNDTGEKESKYQPGYNVLDLDLQARRYTLHARKFIRANGFRFDKDVDSLPDGVTEGSLDRDLYIPLNTNLKNSDAQLPSGYSADVNRIVKLLIGKSLYPNPYIFVRELIQNSVDACNRLKEIHSYATPAIIVNINTVENYFEVSDEGDGMSKYVLKEHFAIIGKSISQESIIHRNINLISQFGIGFISTFIVAERVLISTKSEVDERINLEISNVFKGFNYNVVDNSDSDKSDGTGTTVRVFLKKEHNSTNLFQIARSYCRHIDNIEFYLNGSQQKIEESWNIEKGLYGYRVKNSKFEVKLVIALNARFIIASNSGFLINTNPSQIVPYKFPFIIGGEINFMPNSIDFDISRSSVIETAKSVEIRKEVSVALKKLFREVIEAKHSQLLPLVSNYLQYYLITIDSAQKQYIDSYFDFYSKKDLIALCVELLEFPFAGTVKKLNEIFTDLSYRKISKIYLNKKEPIDDYEHIIGKYLIDKGNLVITSKTMIVQFRDGQQPVNTIQVMQIICKEFGLEIVDMQTIHADEIKDMKMDKSNLPANISAQISAIEKENNIKIEIASFNKNSKPFVKYKDECFINYEHSLFQDLISSHNQVADNLLKIYLLGLLGIGLIPRVIK